MRTHSGSFGVRWIPLTVLVLLSVSLVTAQDGSDPVAGNGWTFSEVQAQLERYPQDVFLQYVGLKLGQRDGFDAADQLGFSERTQRSIAAERRESIDLFSLFSGSLAVQESLQLDAMRPTSDFNQDTKPRPASTVSVAELTGPTVKSHPWHEMLKGQTPKFSGLANYVPADNYYIRFGSVSRLLDVIDNGNLFAKHLYSQSGAPAIVRDTDRRLRQQLAIETNPLARPFYDLVVKELAITGSDPFVNEGSDVTLLFRFEQELVFRTQMDAYLTSAEQTVADVQRSEETWEGIPFIHLTSPNRGVHVFSAYPDKGLHVRSNSRTAFFRILRLIKGQNSKTLTSLGATEEFQYIRTLMPFEAPEEDGLIYLSDAFIRRLVGPDVKLTELRRLKCFNNLRMIGHASAMFMTEHGHRPRSLEELNTANCLPDGFGSGQLTCQCGGRYQLSPDGRHGICSHHGHADLLVPCCEIPEGNVTNSEARAYQEFVTAYSQYWRTFFDPIAIRVQADSEHYRLETIVLPLINNSLYQSLAATLGGKPKSLGQNVTSDAIMSLSFAVAKDRLLQQSGWHPPEESDENTATVSGPIQDASAGLLKQLGLALHNFHDTNSTFPAAYSKDENGKPLLSWRVLILPYLDQARLYEEFHLDEPWDSPHNKRLIGRMPAAFKAPGTRSLKPGMTTYLTVGGQRTVFPADGSQTRFRNILDGTSNTGMVIDAATEFATIWTKPDDSEFETAALRKALHDRFHHGGLTLFADGSVKQLRDDLNDLTIANVFTRDDGNDIGQVSVNSTQRRRRSDPFGLNAIMGGRISQREVYDFLNTGLGDQIGLHVCDSDPMFDVQLSAFLSQMLGGQANRRNFDGESLWVGMAIASLTSPVYINVSVNDEQVVDRFLSDLDEGVALEVRKHTDFGFFAFRKDFYTVPIGDTTARSFVLSIGPVKWRFFYARIGSNLYIASKLRTLEQLVAREGEAAGEQSPPETVSSAKGHAQLAIHRQHWKQILPAIRLSWDEGARKVCLDNIGPLTSAARVATAVDGQSREAPQRIADMAASIYGAVHYCPCGGHYQRAADGRMTCSVHGDADRPQQPALKAANGASVEMLKSFREIRVTLTFLDDGLHAVLEVDRSNADASAE